MLKIENLTIKYPGKRLPIIKDINAELPKGAIGLLLGDSGSGKTSFCLAVAGLLKHARPEADMSGSIIWDNKVISQKDYNRGIAITLENPYSQLTGLKRRVSEEIAFGLEMQGIAPEIINQRVQHAADIFGIAKILLRDPRSLSGGEIQRVIIASSYVLRPELWILDRPLTELDPLARLKLLRELQTLSKQNEMTVIIAEEPDADLYAVATHILTVEDERMKLSIQGARDYIPADSKLVVAMDFKKTRAENSPQIETPSAGVIINELEFQYTRDQPLIINNLSLSLNSGECLWILGPNGCGKTTLAKIVAGIIKPSKGEVRVNGFNVLSEPVWNVARHVAYAFQNPDLQFFSSNVWNEICFGPKALGYPMNEYSIYIKSLLISFDLDGKENYHPHDLTRSERKRLGLASVFAMDTRVIILDEPTQFQSSQEKKLIRQAIVDKLNQGKILIITSHDLDFIW